jgi:arylsulfatase A
MRAPVNLVRGFLLTALLCAANMSFAAQAAGKPIARAPNIVLIFADDLGWSDLASYGNKIVSTPHIDALTKAGMRFTRFYATPVCSPSRAELQSGLYAARTGITDFIPGHWRPFEKVITPRPALVFPTAVATMGETLRRRGYATGYFGKWHLGELQIKPADRGYEETLIGVGLNHMMDDGTPAIEALGDRAADFLERHRNKPFFLMLSPTQVHAPLRAERQKVEKYRARLAAAQTSLPDPIYAAMIEDLDGLVGRVAARLDELQLADSTLMIFVSDNGGLEHLDLGIGTSVTSNAPLRGEKGTVYEGGIRVPLVARWPGKIRAHTVQDTPAAIYDLLPTFLELAGAPQEERANLDGSSLVSLLRGAPARALSKRPLYFHYPHYHHGRPASAVIQWPWKLIENLDDGSIELYNLERDIGERHNLIGKERRTAARLAARLTSWRVQVGAKMPAPNPKFDPDRAAEWWDVQSGKPLDLERMRKLLAPGQLSSGKSLHSH